MKWRNKRSRLAIEWSWWCNMIRGTLVLMVNLVSHEELDAVSGEAGSSRKRSTIGKQWKAHRGGGRVEFASGKATSDYFIWLAAHGQPSRLPTPTPSPSVSFVSTILPVIQILLGPASIHTPTLTHFKGSFSCKWVKKSIFFFHHYSIAYPFRNTHVKFQAGIRKIVEVMNFFVTSC